MKRYLYMVWAGLGLVVALRFWNAPTHAQKNDPIPPNQATSESREEPEKPQAPKPQIKTEDIENSDDKLLPRKETVDPDTLPRDLTPFKRITSDPALIRILATFRPPAAGTVEETAEGRFLFKKGDTMRFEAAQIGPVRSEAKDGSVALEAITAKDGKPLREAEVEDGKVTTLGNAQEIWVVTPQGRSERVSPENLHAEFPIISPDGRYVAFTARALVEGTLRAKTLVIRDRVNGKLTSYADRTHGFDYEIKAVDWVEDGNVLRVVEDWGETGGHLNLKEVRVR